MNNKIVLRIILSYTLVLFIVSTLISVLNYIFDAFVFQNPSFLGFMEYYGKHLFTILLPSILVLGIIKLVYIYPFKTAELLMNNDSNRSSGIDVDQLNKAEKRIYRLPLFLFIIHAAFFIAQFVIYAIQAKYIKSFFSLSTMFYFVLGLSASGIYSFIQNSINNQLLMPLRELFEIHYMDNTKKYLDLSILFRTNMLMLVVVIFSLLFIMQKSYSIYQQQNYEVNLLKSVSKSEITLEQADILFKNYLTHKQMNSDVQIVQADFNKTNSAFLGMLLASFIVLLILCLISVFPYTKEIRKQILSQQITMENILSGKDDFSKRLCITQFDELGKLSSTINTFIDKFKNILESIFTNTNSVHEVSGTLDHSLNNASCAIEEMVRSIEQITTNTNTQIKIVEKIKGKIEEMLVGIDGTSFDVNELTSFVQETSSAAQETSASMKTVANSTAQVNKLATNLVQISKNGSISVSNAIDAIREIETASELVSNIVNIISDIASQTNLLAMNASIEAAHAGQAGKGFAVVAEEIRKLAEKSNENTTQITNHIKNMMEKVIKGVELSREAGNAFVRIDEDINKTTQYINHVSDALQEQSQGTNEIMVAIEAMVKSTIEVKEIADDLKRMSEEIHKHMEELYNVSLDINNATDEQDKGNKEILSLINIVKDASVKNMTVVDRLYSVINDYNVKKAIGN